MRLKSFLTLSFFLFPRNLLELNSFLRHQKNKFNCWANSTVAFFAKIKTKKNNFAQIRKKSVFKYNRIVLKTCIRLLHKF